MTESSKDVTATATFTKLRSGEWGIRVVGKVEAGDTVLVKKKSGDVETKTIDRVIWHGNGVSICAIRGGAYRSRGRAYGSRGSRYYGSQYCGYPCPVTGLKCCPENGPCHDCE